MNFDFALLTLLSWIALGVTLWALVDAIIRPAEAYVAAGKLTKPAWLAILGVAALVQLLGAGFTGLFGIVALIAAIVYLVDVRPAVRSMRRGGPWG